MSEKWTKGPWFVEVGTGEDNEGDIYVCHEGTVCDETTVVNFGLPTIEEYANAHLIAAAPDLYAALKAIIDDLPISRDWLDPVNERWAKDALKKARGES